MKSSAYLQMTTFATERRMINSAAQPRSWNASALLELPKQVVVEKEQCLTPPIHSSSPVRCQSCGKAATGLYALVTSIFHIRGARPKASGDTGRLFERGVFQTRHQQNVAVDCGIVVGVRYVHDLAKSGRETLENRLGWVTHEVEHRWGVVGDAWTQGRPPR